jgi:hypothetical protein
MEDPVNAASTCTVYQYLTAGELQELKESEPKAEDFYENDGKKFVDREKLKVAVEGLLTKGRIFRCFQHLKEYALVFASNWGFHLNVKSSFHLTCARAAQETNRKNDEAKANTTPSRKRTRVNTTKVGCEFTIRSSAITPTNPPVGWTKSSTNNLCQVKITSCNLQHCEACEPGVDSQVLARMHSGFYCRNHINPERLTTIVDEINTGGYKDPWQLRAVLLKYLPANVTLSSNDLHNFRVRAKILYLKGGYQTISQDDANRMFNGLDDKERLDGELTRKVASALLREAWSDSGAAWMLETYFKKLEEHGKFYYHIGRDARGRPTGVWWATEEMLQDFVRYGDFISLDSMKRQYNDLLWPYIGVCVLDDEFRVRCCCESISVEESFASYAWIFLMLIAKARVRPKESIKAIFGDCIMTPTLLDEQYLDMDTCRIFWDHYHLLNKVWEPWFGKDSSLFAQLRPHLQSMLAASSQAEFGRAITEVKLLLAGKVKHLEYMETYFSSPQLFAAYEIDSVPGLLERRGSQSSEANHSSIRASLGIGDKQPVEQQVQKLLDRQSNLRNKMRSDDYKYKVECHARAATEFAADEHGRRDALMELSRAAFDDWERDARDARNYIQEDIEENGVVVGVKLHRRFTAPTTSRILRYDEPCSCSSKKCFQRQCKHEFLRDKGFNRTCFSQHWIASNGNNLEDIDSDHDDYDNADHDDYDDDDRNDAPMDLLDDDNHDHDDDDGENAILVAGTIDSAASNPVAGINDVAIAEEELSDDGGQDGAMALTQTQSTKTYNYNELRDLCNPLIQCAAGDKQKSAILAGMIVQLTAMMRGQQIDSAQPFHDILSQHRQNLYGGGARAGQTQFLGPVMGKKQCTKVVARRLKSANSPSNQPVVKNGAKKCGFCLKETGHVYSGCPEYKVLGTVVSERDVFAANLISGQIQVSIGAKNQDAAIFDAVPKYTKWLVFHDLHLRDSLHTNTGNPADLVAEVSCHASGGQFEKDEYRHCFVPAIGSTLGSALNQKAN